MRNKIDIDVFWKRLTYELSSEQLICNWTAYHDFYGEDFKARYNQRGFIECDAPGAEEIQRVTKKTINKVYPNWEEYKNKKIARKHFMKISRHSKYSISLLHQFENLMEE